MKRLTLVALVALVSACGKSETKSTEQATSEDLRAQYVGYWGRKVGASYDDMIQVTSESKVHRHFSPSSYDSMVNSHLAKLKDKDQKAGLELAFKNYKKRWTLELGGLEMDGAEVIMKTDAVKVNYGPISKENCFTASSYEFATKTTEKSEFCKLNEDAYRGLLLKTIVAKQEQVQKILGAGKNLGKLAMDAAGTVLENGQRAARTLFMNRGNAKKDVSPLNPEMCAPDESAFFDEFFDGQVICPVDGTETPAPQPVPVQKQELTREQTIELLIQVSRLVSEGLVW